MEKVAVVTGSSSGIGHSVVSMLIAQGYQVHGLSRRRARFENNYVHHHVDLQDKAAIHAVVKALPTSVELLVHCAGSGSFKPLEQFSFEEISAIMQVNVTAAMMLTQALLPHLVSRRGAAIYISSIEAVRSMRHSAIYSASKSALRAFALSLYEEVRKSGVMVSVINPDMTDTPFFDEKRFAPSTKPNHALLAQDIAEVIAQLLTNRPRISTVEITVRSQYFGIEKR